MYKKKTKRYHNHTVVESTDQDIYNLFQIIRFHSKSPENFEIELSKVLKEKEVSISDITYQGNNLITYASIYENEQLFNFLIDNYKENLKEHLPTCIRYTYHNQSPIILKKSLTQLGIPDEKFKEHLIDLSTSHCYREENISVFKEWFEKYCSEDDILNICKTLINKNNKPFLYQVGYDNYWKKSISTILPDVQEHINAKQLNFFLHKICGNEHIFKKTDTSEHSFNLSLLNQGSTTKNKDEDSELSYSLPKHSRKKTEEKEQHSTAIKKIEPKIKKIEPKITNNAEKTQPVIITKKKIKTISI